MRFAQTSKIQPGAPGVGGPTYTLGDSEQPFKGDVTASWPLGSWDAHSWNPVTMFQKSSGHMERRPMASTKVSANSQQKCRQVIDRAFSPSPQSARPEGFKDFTAATRGLRQRGAKKAAPFVHSPQSPDHNWPAQKALLYATKLGGNLLLTCSTRTLAS